MLGPFTGWQSDEVRQPVERDQDPRHRSALVESLSGRAVLGWQVGVIDHSQQGLLRIGPGEHERRVEDPSISQGDATDAVLDDVDPGNTGVGLDRGSEGDRTSCKRIGDRPHSAAREGELPHPPVVLTDRVVAVYV